MELSNHIEALLGDITAVAAIGDDAVAEAAERLTQALRSSARLRLLDLLSEAALEVGSQLPSGHIEVRLAGQDPSLVYVDDQQDAEPAPAEDGLTVRITVRLPDAVKTAIDAAAAADGVSVNTWLVRELKRALHRGTAHKIVGSRLTGYAEA
jgi:hypothetical protein